MAINKAIIHLCDKKPDGQPTALHLSEKPLSIDDGLDNLLFDINTSYNGKPGKGWGFFHQTSGAFPFSGWLSDYLDGKSDFIDFSKEAVEHYAKLLDESSLATGGYFTMAHYVQGMTDYLMIAVLQHSASVSISPDLHVQAARYVDLSQIQFAARVNLSEWRKNPTSKQYVSYTKPKGGRRPAETFRDFLGVQEGVDSPSETRTLLKAFSDFVESEDMPDKNAREATDALISYSSSQAKLGDPITLEELSGLVDEDRPRAFYEFIRKSDYGLSPEIPADKRTLKQFQRFTGKAAGLSIAFDAHMLGDKIEYDESNGTLLIRNVPTQIKDQIKRAAAAK